MNHNILLLPANYMPYYSDAFLKVEKEYPDAFIEKIKHYSKVIWKSYGAFAQKQNNTKVFTNLSSKDYRYVLYAVNGLTNKQVADQCKLSERTVAKIYTDIYDKLCINSKKELIDEMNAAMDNKKYRIP